MEHGFFRNLKSFLDFVSFIQVLKLKLTVIDMEIRNTLKYNIFLFTCSCFIFVEKKFSKINVTNLKAFRTKTLVTIFPPKQIH